jgi:ACS family D-galactonate transporter-like MFS transporter
LVPDEIDELHPARNVPARIDAAHAGVPRRRWRIAWLLGIGVLVNYFDRVNLSVSSQSLVATFGISDVVFGYLSSAYNWTYAACQLPIGVVLDKFGVRRVGRVGTFLWSVASFGASVTPSLNGLFGARFLLGIGEAPTFPSNAKAIGMWFPEHERGLSTALFDGAAKFASAIGVPLIGAFLLFAGWRWSFALTGAISFFYFLYFWRVYRDPEEDVSLTEAEREYIQPDQPAPALASSAATNSVPAGPAIQKPSPLTRLLTQRKVLGLTLGMGAYNYVFYLLLTWLPRYLATSLHVELLHSFIYTSVPWLVATFTDVAIGGWLIDHLIRRGRDANRVRRIVLIAGTAFGLGILGSAQAHDAASALFWISMSIGGLSAASPVLWATPALIVRPNDVGKVGGIANFAGQISGISAPIITGYLVSSLHSYFWVFGVAAIYIAIGIAGYFFLLGRIEMQSAD